MEPTKLWNGNFVNLILIELMFLFGTYMTNPIVANFAVSLGAAIAFGGFVAGFNSTIAMLARPFLGFIIDRFQRVWVYFAAAVFFVISSLGCALSTTPEMIAVFRAIMGFAIAVRTAVSISFVPLLVPKDCIGQGVAWVSLASTIANALGPMVGERIANYFDYPVSFGIACIIFACGGLLIVNLWRNAREQIAGTASKKNEDGTVKKHKLSLSDFLYVKSLPVSFTAMCSSTSFGATLTLLYLASEQAGVEGAGVYFIAYAGVALFTKPLAGKLADKYGTSAVAAPTLFIQAMAMLVLIFMQSWIWCLAAGAMMGAGQATAYATLQAESVRGVDKEELGRASNTFYIGPDIAMGFGPMIAGAILESFGYMAMFTFCMIMPLIGVTLVIINKRIGNFS